jgi:hypothetical protein
MDVIALALCLMLVSFMLKRSPAPAIQIPERPKVVMSTPKPPPPDPPDDGRWDSARQSQRATRKECLEELLKSASLQRQILLPPLATAEGSRFSRNGTWPDKKGGHSEWMARRRVPFSEKLELPAPAQAVIDGAAPDERLLQEGRDAQVTARHIVTEPITFDWKRVENWNRYYLFTNGGMRIVFAGWGQIVSDTTTREPAKAEPFSIY